MAGFLGELIGTFTAWPFSARLLMTVTGKFRLPIGKLTETVDRNRQSEFSSHSHDSRTKKSRNFPVTVMTRALKSLGIFQSQSWLAHQKVSEFSGHSHDSRTKKSRCERVPRQSEQLGAIWACANKHLAILSHWANFRGPFPPPSALRSFFQHGIYTLLIICLFLKKC